jgi:hypothetical protein
MSFIACNPQTLSVSSGVITPFAERHLQCRSKIPPMPGWKTGEINWQLPILVLLN